MVNLGLGTEGTLQVSTPQKLGPFHPCPQRVVLTVSQPVFLFVRVPSCRGRRKRRQPAKGHAHIAMEMSGWNHPPFFAWRGPGQKPGVWMSTKESKQLAHHTLRVLTLSWTIGTVSCKRFRHRVAHSPSVCQASSYI